MKPARPLSPGQKQGRATGVLGSYKIIHTDVTETLIDNNGFHFAQKMLKEANEGQISDITYLWPRLEGYKPSVKHTMYTKVKNQICAAGYYE